MIEIANDNEIMNMIIKILSGDIISLEGDIDSIRQKIKDDYYPEYPLSCIQMLKTDKDIDKDIDYFLLVNDRIELGFNMIDANIFDLRGQFTLYDIVILRNRIVPSGVTLGNIIYYSQESKRIEVPLINLENIIYDPDGTQYDVSSDDSNEDSNEVLASVYVSKNREDDDDRFVLFEDVKVLFKGIRTFILTPTKYKTIKEILDMKLECSN